jgi:hypothetical protein
MTGDVMILPHMAMTWTLISSFQFPTLLILRIYLWTILYPPSLYLSLKAVSLVLADSLVPKSYAV